MVISSEGLDIGAGVEKSIKKLKLVSMAKEHNNYQKKVIQNYYSNLDKIALNKLQELVAEIYLASSDEQKVKLWQKVASAMKQLKVPPSVAEHILKQKDPQILAKNINEWLK